MFNYEEQEQESFVLDLVSYSIGVLAPVMRTSTKARLLSVYSQERKEEGHKQAINTP